MPTGQFTVNGVQPQPSGEASKVKVKVRVNLHGVFGIHSAHMIEKLEQPAEPMDAETSPDPVAADSVATEPAVAEGAEESDQSAAGSKSAETAQQVTPVN